MTNFSQNFSRIATAAIGAIVLSTACIGVTIAPAQAAAPQVASTR